MLKEEIKKLSNVDLVGQLISHAHTFGDFIQETKDFSDEIICRLENLVMQKPAGSADEIFIKGKIEGLEEARWQINYALPHIDPNGRLEKQTKYLMDAFKKVQEELRAKL